MFEYNYIESIGSALLGALATVLVGYFTLRGQLKQSKVDDSKSTKDFILELQRQIAVEREQMNEQRLEDSKGINENMALVVALQKQIQTIQLEVADWRKKYFDLSNKYTLLQAEHVDLQLKFGNLKEQISKVRNKQNAS